MTERERGGTSEAAAESSERGRMRAALADVRREGYKVAVIYAAADAALAAVTASLLVRVAGPSTVPERLPLPSGLADVVGFEFLTTAAVVGVVTAVVVLLVDVAARVRKPVVEQFEDANPSVQESLRTARDATADGADTRMARRLYEDVLSRLAETSSLGLVSIRRLAVTALLVVGVGLAGVQVAVHDIQVDPLDAAGSSGGGPGGPDPNATPQYSGLKDAEDILGDPEDVSAGDQDLEAEVNPQAGQGDEPASPADSYDQSGFQSGGGVESQRAGYADEPVPEDAALIREYNLAIREEQGDE
jgi:hypothetical protein